jgi:predicted metal-dependent phosphoesterase TrpH
VKGNLQGRVLKVELHAHTDEDPADRVPHTTRDLIDRAADLGYGAIAVTLHDRYFDPAPHAAYARERGVVLLSGIERTIARRHVLLVNFGPECASVRSFEDVVRLRERSKGLVVAPHPFYPTTSAMGRELDACSSIVDAIELNAMYTRQIDFNRRAAAWARANGKPLVGNCDVHLLEQMGTTFSLVDADPDPDAICEAIRRGRVEVRTEPLPTIRAGVTFVRMVIGGVLGKIGGAGHDH